MPAKLTLFTGLMCLTLLSGVANAAFVVRVDSNDLVFTGPGSHEVDLFISFEDSGPDRTNTLDGIQIDITNAANASVRQGDVPSGITGQFFPSFNVNSGNRFAWGGLGDIQIPDSPGVLLSTLTFDVTDNQDFTIGLDFVQATRTAVAIDGGLAGDQGIVSVPTSFTVTSVTAIPEPTAAFSLGMLATGVILRRRRR